MQQKDLFLTLHHHFKPLQHCIKTFMGEICWLINLHRKCCFSVCYTKPLQYDVTCHQCVNSLHSLRLEPSISHAASCPNMRLIILHATVSFSPAVWFSFLVSKFSDYITLFLKLLTELFQNKALLCLKNVIAI